MNDKIGSIHNMNITINSIHNIHKTFTEKNISRILNLNFDPGFRLIMSSTRFEYDS